jgi:hypothetical protein
VTCHRLPAQGLCHLLLRKLIMQRLLLRRQGAVQGNCSLVLMRRGQRCRLQWLNTGLQLLHVLGWEPVRVVLRCVWRRLRPHTSIPSEHAEHSKCAHDLVASQGLTKKQLCDVQGLLSLLEHPLHTSSFGSLQACLYLKHDLL